MIYRSNLQAPDLQPYFKHVHCRPMPHSMGHSVLSDFADRSADDPVFGLYKNCGFWTHDEAAILYNVAHAFQGEWVDIGSHTGWTTLHLVAAGNVAVAVDPMHRVADFRARFEENVDSFCTENRKQVPGWTFDTSANWFHACRSRHWRYDGFVIDGDHNAPCPVDDARNAAVCLRKNHGVILFHDAIGKPVQDGVMHLVSKGFNCKVYSTPHVVALCWRGDFVPPEHQPDPRVKAGVRPYLGEIARFA